jgi:hypothetical protein
MIIALCGSAGSGKDTLASLLINKHNYVKLSFAGTLKDVVSIMFSWDRNLLEGDTKESRLWREQVDDYWAKRLNIKDLTPRFVLQFIGTDVFRNHFHPEIWIACIERKISLHKKVVITDCRFKNEIELIKKYDGKIIKINRDNCIAGSHISEHEWMSANFDHIIDNNGTIEELYSNFESLSFVQW